MLMAIISGIALASIIGNGVLLSLVRDLRKGMDRMHEEYHHKGGHSNKGKRDKEFQRKKLLRKKQRESRRRNRSKVGK